MVDELQIREMLNRLPIGAVQVQSGALFMNAAAERLTGYSNTAIPTLQSWFETLYGDVAETFLEKYLAHRKQGFSELKRGRITRGDGATRLLEFRACRDVVGDVWIIDDITERVAVHAELVEAKRMAESASQAKSDFLANMSHEVRTPLNGILTVADVMACKELSTEQRELLGIVRRSGEDLLYLLNDILDFSKIEAGKLDLEPTEFDPEDVLATTLAGFTPLAEKKGLQLRLETAPSAMGFRWGDAGRFRQIVANFVSNALKFTETGSVQVRLQGLGEEGAEGLALAVADTGLGISVENMKLLFRTFSQVDASTTRRFGGSGLGLAICRQLAGLMGGAVWAESVEGEGSTFFAVLALPRRGDAVEATSRSGSAPHGEPLRKLRLLAAEDNPTNRLVLSTVMGVFGFDLTLVDDGAQALEAWRHQAFDAILMDVQMPVMDGVQAACAIRSEEVSSGRARTPIIALSANAFPHQVSQYLSAGMDDYVAKPIELSALYTALRNATEAAPRGADHPSHGVSDLRGGACAERSRRIG